MEKPAQSQHQAHVLFEFSPLDFKEELDERIQRTYQNLKQMTAGKSVKDCHEIYLKYIANSQHNLEELTMGLLVALLAEQDGHQSKYYRDVVSFSKDSLSLFTTYLSVIIVERLSKLRDHSMKQVFWLTNQLMKGGIVTVDQVCSNLIRQAAGGDLSPRNLWFIENLLDLLKENRNWLINSTTFMVPTIIYTFIRLIGDHMGPAQSTLRQAEVDFVIGLVREKFLDCLQIGRDFLRLLHTVIKIPEFEKLWNDIYNNPKSLHPSFLNPLQLLSNRTPRRLFQSRLTFDMERKINFLATQVKFGSQKRYQDWFHKQYLSTPESLSLRCDLIRYICTIIHPSNEVLCSDIIPRWAIIGWLLTTCTNNPSAYAHSKLALFFDWLLYDAKMDNIMNIEPAILVMFYSARSHPNVTSGLLDFLCRIPAVFSPKLGDHIRAGLRNSLQQILEKRVIPTLAPLFDNPKHDPTLRGLIKNTFPDFCGPTLSHVDNGISHINQPVTPAQNNQPPTTIQNHVTTKQPELIVIDQDKANVSQPESIMSANEIVANKTVPNQDLVTNRPNTDPAPIVYIDEKPDQIVPSSSLKDEPKAFSWNGTENVNASYSHKQNHDNKNLRANSNNESSKKGIIAADPDTIINEFSNHVTKSATSSSSPTSLSTISTIDPDADVTKTKNSNLRVIYPFMIVQDLDLEETIRSFDDSIRTILSDLSAERSSETRCTLMQDLIGVLFGTGELPINPCLLDDIGHCLAYIMKDDFLVRIFPSSNTDTKNLKDSATSPFFVLCRSALLQKKPEKAMRPMCLLVAISKFFEATGFLVLYFLRICERIQGTFHCVAEGYLDFCTAARRKSTKTLQEDLVKALTYDSEMFCFILPSIFGADMVNSGSYTITGNIDLIHLVVSAVDPVSLQELVCLSLTNSFKIINRDDVIPLIEASLNWESWEQFCIWKFISAHNVPVENYINILPKLDTKLNPEAMSCILLNLQRVSEPSLNMVQQIMSIEPKKHDPYVSSILRCWSMKTDVRELAKMISSLSDSRPSSPQVKRKGQTKTSVKNSPTLGSQSEKILHHLESVRMRAYKNRIFAQSEIREMLAQLETVCNETQRRKFAELFSNCPKPAKKQRKMDKEPST